MSWLVRQWRRGVFLGFIIGAILPDHPRWWAFVGFTAVVIAITIWGDLVEERQRPFLAGLSCGCGEHLRWGERCEKCGMELSLPEVE